MNRRRRWPWPWMPREYVATVAALHAAERALATRELEARRTRRVIGEVRNELNKGDRKR